jgi:Domain of unknown function (DUF4157)
VAGCACRTSALEKGGLRSKAPSQLRVRPSVPPRLSLQRALGNRGVETMLRTRLQPKLKVGRPGDRFERGADRVADQAMRALPPDLAIPPAHPARTQRLCPECESALRHRPEQEDERAVEARAHKMPDLAPEFDGRIQARGGGQPLPQATRALFEPRFGWDFGAVRVHTGGDAAAAARGVRARAFTVGRDIVFGAGEYAPATTAGRSLLAHELAHVIQQARGRAAPQVSVAQAEREADAAAAPCNRAPISARPIAVHRQPAPAKTGMARDDFRKRLKAIFGHDVTIEIGDKERQAKELRGPPAKRKLPDDWKAWDPGASSPLYDEILGAILDFGREVGGVPDIRQIVFYDVRYAYDDQLNVVADTNAAAQISTRRIMFVYRAALFETETASGSTFSRSGVFLAAGRSTAGKKGVSAPMDAPSRAQSQRRGIAHELGHGVEFASGALTDFEQAVGWVRIGSELRLYDIQAKGVKAAIARGAEPPAAARITKQDWNSGAHLEQPMRAYAVTDSAEDFADSLMAWIYARDVLKARSPARFKFFDDQARRKGWLPKLVTAGAPAAPPQATR